MSRSPSVALRLVILVSVFVALASWPGVASAQTSSFASPACYAHLSRAGLVSSGKGWAIVDQPLNGPVIHSGTADDCTDEHLYWTDNDGRTWREITPPDMPTRNIGTTSFTPATGLQTVYFLDSSHGRIISTDALNEDGDPRFYFFSTEDGGKNWRRLVIQRLTYKLMDDMWPTEIYFSDPVHGWILWHWSTMNSRSNALLSTSDGGQTWKRLPDPPGAGPLEFISGRDGWMIGGSPGQEGIPVVEDNQLWNTIDGGVHWNAISIHLPADSAANVRFGALKISDRGDGVVVAQASVSDYVERFLSCVTRDGGKSWHFSQFEAYQASPSLVGTSAIWTVFHMPKTQGTVFQRNRTLITIRIGDREIAPTVPSALALEGSFGDVDFSDDSHGWTTFFNGRPSQFGLPGSSFAYSELLSTSDGGNTFRTITPPAAEEHPVGPPELYVLNGSVVRFPTVSPPALRPPPIPSNGPSHLGFAPPAGGPTIITGTGFERENTVWIGPHQIEVASGDGENLRFLIPLEVAPGTYSMHVENSHGKTNEIKISIRSPQSLANLNINNGAAIHPGQEIFISGRGFLLENQVWFDELSVPGELIISGGPMLRLTVPRSVPLGLCDVYVSNAAGKSSVFTVEIE
jgi:photosystem II stability/assembly factor-like uncharacterized protein